eukprot:jgi/Galph1/5586/GphlegSOOS_G4229.1
MWRWVASVPQVIQQRKDTFQWFSRITISPCRELTVDKNRYSLVLEKSKNQTTKPADAVKQEEEDDFPFSFISKRTFRFLKIFVTTVAGITCVFADYSEITEEHVFSGIQRKAKSWWKEMWSVDPKKRMEWERKRNKQQDWTPQEKEHTDEHNVAQT